MGRTGRALCCRYGGRHVELRALEIGNEAFEMHWRTSSEGRKSDASEEGIFGIGVGELMEETG